MENKELMQQQRKLYMDGKLSHSDYYLWLAKFIGANKTHLPVSLDRIRQSQDEHLNDIQLHLWDRRDPLIRTLAYDKRLPWSLCDTVCVLKAIASHEAKAHKVNDKVICNGYPGTVIRTKDSPDSAWLGSMVEVKLDSGVVCVDQKELT